TLNLPLRAEYIDDYSHLNFPDKSFDMSWNFSALWFVKDLQMFLSELDRVTKSIIIIMVPNQTGLGYVQQRYFGQEDLEKYLIESHIRPKTIKAEMEKLNWKLLHHELLDCPLWPDIGMSKEDFLKKLGLGAFSFKKDDNKIEKRPITILDYYSGRNLDMPRQFEKYELFEQHAPESFKRFWAHHQYLLFIR
ncbi:MAG TPA: methyltransferase domain-containing protein, partial [Candidatus Cloacimonadota bacterium]|nr:methyltransferase domain-containing protein [Candidatus Cloacimonadota bacterium]